MLIPSLNCRNCFQEAASVCTQFSKHKAAGVLRASWESMGPTVQCSLPWAQPQDNGRHFCLVNHPVYRVNYVYSVSLSARHQAGDQKMWRGEWGTGRKKMKTWLSNWSEWQWLIFRYLEHYFIISTYLFTYFWSELWWVVRACACVLWAGPEQGIS